MIRQYTRKQTVVKARIADQTLSTPNPVVVELLGAEQAAVARVVRPSRAGQVAARGVKRAGAIVVQVGAGAKRAGVAPVDQPSRAGQVEAREVKRAGVERAEAGAEAVDLLRPVEAHVAEAKGVVLAGKIAAAVIAVAAVIAK